MRVAGGLRVVEAITLASGEVWRLPTRGLFVLHGMGEASLLSHCLLSQLLMRGEHVLFLDGANCSNPRRIACLAREHNLPFESYSRKIQIARAFTCFQLTELTSRVPHFLKCFPARVLIVTALPDLYFDEDARDWDAHVAFEQALNNLKMLVDLPLLIVILSDARAFLVTKKRGHFFSKLKAQAKEVWSLRSDVKDRFELTCENPLFPPERGYR